MTSVKKNKYCGVGGVCVGHWGGTKILQKIEDIAIGAPPPPLPVIKIVKYCDVWRRGGAVGSAKILQKIMAPPLSVIKIVKYCGVVGGGGIGGAKTLQT